MTVQSNLRNVTRFCLTVGGLAALVIGADRVSAQVVTQPVQPVPIYPVPSQVELGPVLDVVPYVLSDGYTIQLTLVPSVREFLGYDPQPNVTIPTQPNTVIVPTILPAFRVRQVVTTVNVWDGQTVVLGGLMSENTLKQKDKVPLLGDLPLVGKLFRSESSTSSKRNLLIFVTPTIIDPAGNRTHTDDDMPFAKSAIPPQPGQQRAQAPLMSEPAIPAQPVAGAANAAKPNAERNP
jgi:type II secretory pathway component GspD/PulD (secretin)